MIKSLLIVVCIFLCACQTTPPHPEQWMIEGQNSCLPTAIVYKQSLRKYDVWAKVFTYQFVDSRTGKMAGHAMCAFLYPPGKNQLWAYDSYGSTRIRAFTNNVADIAQKAHWARGLTNTTYMGEWVD